MTYRAIANINRESEEEKTEDWEIEKLVDTILGYAAQEWDGGISKDNYQLALKDVKSLLASERNRVVEEVEKLQWFSFVTEEDEVLDYVRKSSVLSIIKQENHE